MTVESEVTPISPDPATILLKLQSSSPFQIFTSSKSPSPRKESSPTKKRKDSDFSAFLPKRKMKMTIET